MSIVEMADIAILAGWKPGLTHYWWYLDKDVATVDGIEYWVLHWRCAVFHDANPHILMRPASPAVEWYEYKEVSSETVF